MKTLGVITTTYNRAYCIHQVYASLKKQNCNDFLWLVVDDGSTDNTKAVIDGFSKEGLVEIHYIFQENGGMHAARNTAYESIRTEINVIIDSDDWMADGAVERIVKFWNENKSADVAGIVALDAKQDGEIVGSRLPATLQKTTITELFGRHKATGDKKLIYRSDLSQKYPYPVFEGEKFFPASYKFRLLDLDYKMLMLDEVVCIVDYNEDSMTFDKIKQYRTCAKGFAFFRNEMIRISTDRKYIIKQTIHYIAESLLAKNRRWLRESSNKPYAALCFPAGITLFLYLKHTNRKY